MNIEIVPLKKPESVNLILGQSHFIKTVEDIHETLVSSVPGIAFGLAFCEASGARLVRCTGTDDSLIAQARDNALSIGAGHSFVLLLGEGVYPVNILNQLKLVPEVCHIYCATANATQVIVGETDLGRAILGIVDGQPPLGVEGPEDATWRHDFLRNIGYKL